MKVENHPYVESYWVEELPNGVFHLLINCIDPDYDYWLINDHCYYIFKDEEELYHQGGRNNHTLDIPNFIPYSSIEDIEDEQGIIYVQSVHRNDEQLSIYFIPHQLGRKQEERKFIIIP
jgi:hypothetical protein